MEVVNALGRRKRAVARELAFSLAKVQERLLLTRETLHSTFHQLFFSM